MMHESKMNVESKRKRKYGNEQGNNTPFKVEDVNWEELGRYRHIERRAGNVGRTRRCSKGEKTNVIRLSPVLLGVDVVMDATLTAGAQGRRTALLEILSASNPSDNSSPSLIYNM